MRPAVPGDAPVPPEDEQQPPGDPEAVARVICLRLLDQRARSRAELATALAKRGVPGDAAGRVLDRFTDVGLIDDSALAESLAGAVHRERGLARRGVAAKLRQRGLEDEVVAEALVSIDSDAERTRGQQLVERKRRSMSNLAVEVQTRRLVAMLARKGYPAGMAYEIVRAELSGAGDVDDRAEGDFAAESDDSAARWAGLGT